MKFKIVRFEEMPGGKILTEERDGIFSFVNGRPVCVSRELDYNVTDLETGVRLGWGSTIKEALIYCDLIILEDEKKSKPLINKMKRTLKKSGISLPVNEIIWQKK